jgi:hypothetical protein
MIDQLPGCQMTDMQKRDYDRVMRICMIGDGTIKPRVDLGYTLQAWRDEPTLRLDRVVKIVPEEYPSRKDIENYSR